jgi:hypothetical protein
MIVKMAAAAILNFVSVGNSRIQDGGGRHLGFFGFTLPLTYFLDYSLNEVYTCKISLKSDK